MTILEAYANMYGSDAAAKLHPSVKHVLQFFEFSHLPKHLAEVSQPFADLALLCAHRRPASPETTFALRKLLEAKDCAVRAMLEPAS